MKFSLYLSTSKLIRPKQDNKTTKGQGGKGCRRIRNTNITKDREQKKSSG